eukprot:SAG31_NODE_646_length_13223_cov_14.088845_8_plen_557_part_00
MSGEVEQLCAELDILSARVQDKSLPVPERQAATAKFDQALRSVTGTDAMATVGPTLLELEFVEWLCISPAREVFTYLATGEFEGYDDAPELFSFAHTRWGALFAPFDGWGSHDHPEWRHRVHDSVYSGVPRLAAGFVELCGDRTETPEVLSRAREWGAASACVLCESGYGTMQLGGIASAAHFSVCFPRCPAVRREATDAFLRFGGSAVLQAFMLPLREAPVNSADLYVAAVTVAMLTRHCLANADLTARLFGSGMLEAYVGLVDRSRASEVSPHCSINRGVGQFAANVAASAEGRARLLATQGMEEALVWLLEHGGDPVGIAENRTLADPRGMAGLSLALLRGREEDAQVALPSKVVRQIVSMIETYSCFGANVVLPYAEGLSELSVSDANKRHLTAIPAIVDSLRRNLGVNNPDSNDATEQSLRTCSCSTLAQLAASEVTLPLLLGHAVLKDLEQVRLLPETSKDACNDAMAVLFAVQQHEKRAGNGGSDSVDSLRHSTTSDSWIMLSYQWGVQAMMVRIRDSLRRRKYRVWMDIEHMRGSVRSMFFHTIAADM